MSKPTTYNKNGKGKGKGKLQDQEPIDPTAIPQNADVERIVLASFMADNSLVEKNADILTEDDFSTPLHAKAYGVMVGLVAKGKPANQATITAHIQESSPVPDMSVSAYMINLNHYIKGSAEIGAYIEELKLYSKRRAAFNLSTKFAKMAQSAGHDIIDKLSFEVSQLSTRETSGGMLHIGDDVDEVYREILENNATGWGITGLSTGFPELDRAIGGLKKSKFYVIAAAEKAGKSAAGLSIMRNLARQDVPVGIISLEMKRKEVVQRLIQMEAGANYSVREQGAMLLREEIDNLSDVADRVKSWNIYCDDFARLTPSAIAIKARHAVKVHGCQVLLVDYLQIVNPDDERDEQRSRVEKASRAMAQLAKELDISIVALAQINRQANSRNTAKVWKDFQLDDCRPRRGDVRETAQIEMDVDVLISLYRPYIIVEQMRPTEPQGPDDAERLHDMRQFEEVLKRWESYAELNVLLQRGSKSGQRQKCTFFGEAMRFDPADTYH